MTLTLQKWRPEAAIVLAAGLGTRMRTADPALPKPLIELCGRTLLDRVLDRISAAPIARVVVNVHYKADLIVAHLATRHTPSIAISDERAELLDTGGGVRKALAFIGADVFVRHNSDSVWIEAPDTNNIGRLCDAWNASTMSCCLLLAERKTALGYDGQGDFHLDNDGRIRRRLKGETADYVFAGVDVLTARAFDDMPDGPFSLNLIWDRAIAAGRAYAIVLDGRWMHVGTPEARADAEALLRQAEGTHG